jgi:MFS transporter, MHS family, proline/betaine transporter
VQTTGNKAAPVYYILFAAAVGLAGLSAYRRRTSEVRTAPQPAL